MLDLINTICYNFEAYKNKFLTAVQNQKYAMIWHLCEGSTIAEYIEQFINQVRVSE